MKKFIFLIICLFTIVYHAKTQEDALIEKSDIPNINKLYYLPKASELSSTVTSDVDLYTGRPATARLHHVVIMQYCTLRF